MYERYTRRCPTSFFVEKEIKRLPTASADFLDLGIVGIGHESALCFRERGFKSRP